MPNVTIDFIKKDDFGLQKTKPHALTDTLNMLDHKAPHHAEKDATSTKVQNNNFAGKINSLTLEESKDVPTKELLLMEQAQSLTFPDPSRENHASDTFEEIYMGEDSNFELHTEGLPNFEPIFEIGSLALIVGLLLESNYLLKPDL